jgi:DNA-directed RNA polymerase subunit RPC12/RpoP
MYVTYDYRCIDCKKEEIRMVKKEDRDKQYCKYCISGVMLRLPPATRTTFKFNDK